MKMRSRFALEALVVALSIATVVGCASPSSKGGTAGQSGGGGTTGSGGTTASGAGGTTTGSSAGTTGSSGAAGTTGSSGAAGTTGSSGAAGTTGSSGAAGTTGTTGVAGTTGGGAAGAGGATVVVQKLCAIKTTPMNPVFLNFENYDGTVTADKYSTAFGGATPNTGTAYAGVYSFGDGSATPTLALMAGHPPSNWGVSQSVTQASAWGMGGGVWMGCADASAYRGISFWVRGSSGTGMFSFDVSMESTQLPNATNSAGGGTCPGTADTCKDPSKANLPITADWTQVQILWADFTPGTSGTTSVVPNGNNIAGLVWNVPLQDHLDPTVPADAAGPYVAIPGNLLIDIDDVSFIQ